MGDQAPGLDAKTAAELAELIAHMRIVQVLHRYAHAMDYGREDEWVSVFTPDAVFHVVHLPGEITQRRFEGSGQLADYIRDYPKPPNNRQKHIVLDPVIEVEGDVAHVESYWVLLARRGFQPLKMSFGRYIDELRAAEGEWRIAHRYAETEWSQELH